MAPSLPAAMRAWQYSRFGGGADALELATDVPMPTAGRGEVVVKVQAASVNPVDWKLQLGFGRPLLPPKLPFIPGLDVVGDQVFGMGSVQQQGGFGEYARLSSAGTAHRPAAVSPATASCLGVAAVTALQALRDSAGVPMGAAVVGSSDSGGTAAGSSSAAAAPATAQGKRVLVANASGGVGHYAVQLAKLAGAHVTATCGARNADFVKSLGAEEVLDYKTPDGQALKAPTHEPYDAIVDGTGGLSWKVVEAALKPGGRWVHLTPDASVFALAALHAVTFSSKRCIPMFASGRTDDLSAVGRLAAEGRLKTHIHAEVPFDSAPESWKKSMEGHVVVKVVVVSCTS